MRICIYNQYWATLGGGEKYLGEFASALSIRHQVELLSPDPTFTLKKLKDVLEVDTSNLILTKIDSPDQYYIEILSANYDLFINGSYNSSVRSRSKHSVLIVYFPQILLESNVLPRPQYYITGSSDRFIGQLGEWIFGQVSIVIFNYLFKVDAVYLYFDDRIITCNIDASFSESMGINSGEVSASFIKDEHLKNRHIVLRFDPICPGYLKKIVVKSFGLKIKCGLSDSEKIHSSYQNIVTISDYSRDYISKRWKRIEDVYVIAPPVNQYKPMYKEKQILSVGRFFKGDHSKKHDILIDAFRKLNKIDSDIKLHLVGGISNNPTHISYANELKELASGLPVEFHFNATRDTLSELYANSMIYWHATGYGENLIKYPDRAEHFGITPLEAMSSACIPVVFNAGGMASYIDHGVNGFLWTGIDELVDITQSIFSLIGESEVIANNARGTSLNFRKENFSHNVNNFIDLLEKGVLR